MHTARSFQLLPLQTDIDETHETLNAVQVLTYDDVLSHPLSEAAKLGVNVFF
jgi:hypothetical protein